MVAPADPGRPASARTCARKGACGERERAVLVVLAARRTRRAQASIRASPAAGNWAAGCCTGEGSPPMKTRRNWSPSELKSWAELWTQIDNYVRAKGGTPGPIDSKQERAIRSEERRVGKECRSRWTAWQEKKKEWRMRGGRRR